MLTDDLGCFVSVSGIGAYRAVNLGNMSVDLAQDFGNIVSHELVHCK